MRLFALAACFIAVAALHAGDDQKKSLEKLQGEWKADKATIGGKDILENVQKQKFVFKDKTITVHEDDKATDNVSKFEIDLSAKPPIIDVETKDGDKLEGIFELKADSLKICISLQKGNRPTEFISPADSMTVLIELKRVKK